jgi:hypothetical protein
MRACIKAFSFLHVHRGSECASLASKESLDEFAPVRTRRYTNSPDDVDETELPCEPAGHGVIATGRVQSCKQFWRKFVRITGVMDLFENGYELLWIKVVPPTKERANAPSTNDHHDFVSSAVVEMLATNVVGLLTPGEKPAVVSPLGVMPKRGTDKFRLTVNMRYVNHRLGKEVFKIEGLKDLANLMERGNYAVSYYLMSGYYHVGLHLRFRTFVRFQWKGKYYRNNCLPFGLSTTLWFLKK